MKPYSARGQEFVSHDVHLIVRFLNLRDHIPKEERKMSHRHFSLYLKNAITQVQTYLPHVHEFKFFFLQPSKHTLFLGSNVHVSISNTL